MGYTALYREWRPKTFEEVVGQEHVTRTLRNAVASGRIGHAYLFAGPRGTGKTSVAKILARAINCLNPSGPEPCNACRACRSIADGSASDVLEIDAASNRGIDEIRDLREKARFCPSSLKFKVYIIDEVHMLTSEAFNALLKTLEEPPPHAVFVLATTEAHKVPLTVISRCQRFSFHRISLQEMTTRLEAVCAKAGINADPEAIDMIARAADGSLRDALSILDQCVSFGDGKVSVQQVREMLGESSFDSILRVIECINRGDAAGLFAALEAPLKEGKDPRHLVRELLLVYRDLLRAAASGKAEEALGKQEMLRLQGMVERYSQQELVHIISVLSDLDGALRFSSQPRIVLEAGLIKLLDGRRPRAEVSTDKPTGVRAPADRDPRQASAGVGLETVNPDEAVFGTIRKSWDVVVARLKKDRKARIAALLLPAKPMEVRRGRLILQFPVDSQFHMGQIQQPDNSRAVEEAIRAVTGITITLECVSAGEAVGPNPRFDADDLNVGSGTDSSGAAEGESPASIKACHQRDDRPSMRVEDPFVKGVLEILGGTVIQTEE